MILIIPTFVVLLASIIWIGQVTFARAKLQVSVDRAAHAGASYMAHVLNEVARSNWKINKAYRDLEEDFRNISEQNTKAAKERFQKYAGRRDIQLNRIADLSSGMNAESRRIAKNLALSNEPEAEAEAIAHAVMSISDSADGDAQYGNPTYDYIDGEFGDPNKYKSKSFRALKYLVRERSAPTFVAVVAERKIKPIFLSSRFGGELGISASSAAVAYGGSVKEFALRGGSSDESAAAQVSEDGIDHLYRAALVPMWTVGLEGNLREHE